MTLTPDDYREVQTLLSALREKQIVPQQSIRLNQFLRDSDDARRLYLQHFYLSSMLHWLHDDALVGGGQPAAVNSQPPGSIAQPIQKLTSPVLGFLGRAASSLNRPLVWSIVAVAAAFYGTFTFISWNLRPEKLASFAAGKTSVAVVRDATDVQWSKNAAAKSTESSILSGEPLRIESGTIELELNAGTRLVVEGPAEWSVDGRNRVSLRAGKLLAYVPEQAIGFTVETPTAKVVDLGTEFGVEVSADGVANVAVLKGRVNVTPVANVGQKSTNSQRLVAGETVQIDTLGNIHGRGSALTAFKELRSHILPPTKSKTTAMPEGIRLWLRADKGMELDAEGRVERWQDQSGRGFDAVQPQSHERPRFVTETVRGPGRAAAFDGVDDFLTCDHGLDISSADDMTMFLLLADVPVFRGEGGVFSLRPREGKDNASYDGFGIDFGTADSATAINFGQGGLDLPVDAGWNGISLCSRSFEPRWPLMVVVTKQQGTATLRVNSKTLAIDTYKFIADDGPLTNTAGYVIGRRAGVEPIAGINHFANISVAELLIFDRAFTGRQATKIETQILERHAQSTNEE
jgi:hypothetical protein